MKQSTGNGTSEWSAPPLALFDHRSTSTGGPPSRRYVTVAGRRLAATPVFDTYWKFAAERQIIYEARLGGHAGPWTTDAVLRNFRFTNCFRAADRVSQFLIEQVAYAGPQDARNLVFRTLLFKMFNRTSTWNLLEAEFGQIVWETFDLDAYDRVLGKAFASGERLYSAAYVIPPPAMGGPRKHTNHLRLIDYMINDGVDKRLADAASMGNAFEVLRGYPALGDFLAYQFLIDINYSTALNFSENEFVVAGPGARDGIRKCFGPSASGIESEVIRYMADHQDECFTRAGLTFNGLRGRPLHLIDCQNLFCEVDKYSRVAHPDILGISGRTRIKQRYTPVSNGLSAWFPPKWGLNF